ncbi:chitin binding peritrophin-A domain-containing protein [Chitinophaga deserti]|uniref:chitin binding peritrophin-A domain-containing protein n=1 Tax=Chitinophaga deserti TaxID=2164099 RepID=UPI00130045CA|nr:chitin binding peritrophin-A domain-containing protein [Chitinophaga deserti]
MKKQILKWSAMLMMTAALTTTFITPSTAYPVGSCYDPYGGKRNTLPDDTYCHVFYTCDDWYQPVMHECPWGLVFDMQLEVCNWPEFSQTWPWCW